MRLAASFVVVLCIGACSFDGSDPVAGDAGQASDGSPTPDAASSDGPIDPNDTDGDMVPDSIDNCPDVQNPLQHDEDLDLLGDLCDNCAWIQNAGQANDDDDDLGDACDPRPTSDGDVLLFFDSFYRGDEVTVLANDDPNWAVLVGNQDAWRIENDRLIQPSNSGFARAVVWNDGDGGTSDDLPAAARVIATGTITNLPVVARPNTVSIVSLYALVPQQDAVGCTVGRPDSLGSLPGHARLEVTDGTGTLFDYVFVSAIAQDKTIAYQFDFDRDADASDCSVSTAGVIPYDGVLSTSSLGGPPGGRTGFRTLGAGATFDFIAIIGEEDD